MMTKTDLLHFKTRKEKKTIMSKAYYYRPADVDLRVMDADLCVYGGTAGGVIAAIEAAQRGLKVVVIEPSAHLGGMTAGGLGFTDLGRDEYFETIGGLALEFYRRVGQSYGVEHEWKFEPHVAEKVFKEWLQEKSVPVFHHEFIRGVQMEENRMVSLSTISGLTVNAKMFLDAGYDGDLLAAAGVSYTVGRENNIVYGESFNGMQIRDNRFEEIVDAYFVPGVPSSGFIPGVEGAEDYRPGMGDHRIQAYNFRMCLTREKNNILPILKPDRYVQENYILLERYIAAGMNRIPGKFDAIRNQKVDMNNEGAVSTDFIGQNHAWPEADYQMREKIFQDHVSYQQGLMWHLANSKNIPDSIKEPMREWGLAADEFKETGGWPHALYVRESRRMISDLVMTEDHCLGEIVEDHTIGLAAHGMDSHTCRRVVRGGHVYNEGDVQIHPLKPYAIPFEAIVPREKECDNLLVTFCVSASHIAFGSIRMEPVNMVISQSAAIAAAIAIDEKIPLQRINYSTLRSGLQSSGQVLEWS
jgi:hypothetical protein